MACSKLKPRFRDEDVEYRIVLIEQGTYTGDPLTQLVKQLRLKCEVWDELAAHVCTQVTILLDEINRHHKNANIAKGVGGFVGILSGVGAVVAAGVGAALALPTAGASIPISSTVVGACCAVACVGTGAGAVTAGGAVVVDGMIRLFNQKEAIKWLESEEELREHIIVQLQELQRKAQKYEELMKVINRMKRFEYSTSLKSIEKGSQSLQVSMDYILDDGFLKELDEFPIASFSSIADLEGKLDKSTFLSSFSSVITTVSSIFTTVTATLKAIKSVAKIASNLHKVSNKKVAAQLRAHLDLLESDRIEINKALRPFFMDT